MSVTGRREGGGVCNGGVRVEGVCVDGGTSEGMDGGMSEGVDWERNEGVDERKNEGVVLHLSYVAFVLLDHGEGVDAAVELAVQGLGIFLGLLSASELYKRGGEISSNK